MHEVIINIFYRYSEFRIIYQLKLILFKTPKGASATWKLQGLVSILTLCICILEEWWPTRKGLPRSLMFILFNVAKSSYYNTSVMWLCISTENRTNTCTQYRVTESILHDKLNLRGLSHITLSREGKWGFAVGYVLPTFLLLPSRALGLYKIDNPNSIQLTRYLSIISSSTFRSAF